MLVDLHCHSSCSDGSETPQHVAEMACARGVALFCLTDHDTCAGFVDSSAAAGDMVVVRGVELSCREAGRPVHLLLYDAAIGPGWELVEEVLTEVKQARRLRLRDIADRLAGLGMVVDVDSILAAAAGRAVGRPDIARALVSSGQVGSIQDAFTRYLYDGGPGDVAIDRVSVEAGLELGRRAGCKVALAHPHLQGNRAHDLVRRYRDSGLGAIEAYYGLYNARARARWAALAAAEGLVVTAGSDYHGDLFPKVKDVGVELPDIHYQSLLAWLQLG
jgi:predicted metal-dependent phosphoesterase TrpH